MPPKTKSSKKLSKHSSPESSSISKFCRGQDIPDDIKDVLVEHQITSKQVFASITEQDLADMGFLVGQKFMLRRMLSLLRQDGEGPPADTANAALSASAKDLLPGFNLAEEISQLEAEVQVPQSTQENKASETATFATTSAASGSASSAASGSKAALSSPASLSTNSSDLQTLFLALTVHSSNCYSCLIRNLFSRILRFLSLFLLRVLAKPLITSHS